MQWKARRIEPTAKVSPFPNPMIHPYISFFEGRNYHSCSLIAVERGAMKQLMTRTATVINPAFSINNIRRLEPVFQRKAKEVTSLFERALEASNGSSTAAIDCTATFTKATLDVMGVALFGVDLSGLNSTQVRGTAAGRQRESEMTFHEAYDGIFGQDSLGRILMFANAFVPVRWLPLDANRKYLRATRWLEDFLTRLVRERVRDVRRADAGGKYARGEARDLLTFIVEESLPGGPADEITQEEIVGDVSSNNCLSNSIHCGS